jgi:hypothetical protein
MGSLYPIAIACYRSVTSGFPFCNRYLLYWKCEGMGGGEIEIVSARLISDRALKKDERGRP